jgi:hypothetical protein
MSNRLHLNPALAGKEKKKAAPEGAASINFSLIQLQMLPLFFLTVAMFVLFS